MKTAISVPDRTYERAERIARAHGMSRSQFYATAADRYAEELESADASKRIDEALDLIASAASDDAEFVAQAAKRRLTHEGDAW